MTLVTSHRSHNVYFADLFIANSEDNEILQLSRFECVGFEFENKFSQKIYLDPFGGKITESAKYNVVAT